MEYRNGEMANRLVSRNLNKCVNIESGDDDLS